MKTIEETRRELFQAQHKNEAARLARIYGAQPSLEVAYEKDENGLYLSGVVQAAWWGFNAALDAVCIELPKRCAFESLDNSGVFVQLTYEIGRDSKDPVELVRLSDCRAAIESTNLGLKVI